MLCYKPIRGIPTYCNIIKLAANRFCDLHPTEDLHDIESIRSRLYADVSEA